MTSVQIEAMKKYAESLIGYISPCPWNPFPRDSKWGRQIEEQYRRDQINKRLGLEDDDDWHDNGW